MRPSDIQFAPPQASTLAEHYDKLWWFLCAITFAFTMMAVLGVFWFAVRYRRRSDLDRPRQILGSLPLELAWTLTPLAVFLVIFFWGAGLFFEYATPPSNAMEIYVTGRQWMWKVQHPEGPREINEMHVPAGRPIKLVMTSEDVIHSYFIPAFRIKRDVLPGGYSQMWFTATQPGQYHLFCAEYCGSKHSAMGGWVYVMDPTAYEDWLSGTTGMGGMGSMAQRGESLFAQYGCASCHRVDTQGRCPNLTNVYNSQVRLNSGATVVANETYLRESILNPGAKIVYGFQNIMPSFQGQLNEEQLLQLIAYIRSLNSQPAQSPQGTKSGTNVVQGGVAGQENFNNQGTRGTQDNTTRFRNLRPQQ